VPRARKELTRIRSDRSRTERASATHSTRTGNTLSLSFTGAQPDNSIVVELPILRNNINATTAGTIDSNDGVVALTASTKQVTITLANPTRYNAEQIT
jgi:hypothetical protein